MTSSTSPAPFVDAVPDAAQLHALLSRYRTCEFATITRSGVPAAWPAVCLVAPDARSIVLTTCIGLPLKAFNVRRDPRVALLFSDPTGAGPDALPQVLVQGTAVCPDEIRTSPAGLEDYWTQLAERQPSSRALSSSTLMHPVLDFYYMRLVITVTPETVTVRPPLVRTQPPAAPGRMKKDGSVFGQVARRLSSYQDAVLATVPDAGLPDLRRVRVTSRSAQRDLHRVDATDPTATLPSGPANLLFHGHDAQIDQLRQIGVFGELTQDSAGAGFRPDRCVTTAEAKSPAVMIATMRRTRRSTRRYLAARGLERPTIPWAEYRALFAEMDRNG
jgi:hypothetical protein